MTAPNEQQQPAATTDRLQIQRPHWEHGPDSVPGPGHAEGEHEAPAPIETVRPHWEQDPARSTHGAIPDAGTLTATSHDITAAQASATGRLATL